MHITVINYVHNLASENKTSNSGTSNPGTKKTVVNHALKTNRRII